MLRVEPPSDRRLTSRSFPGCRRGIGAWSRSSSASSQTPFPTAAPSFPDHRIHHDRAIARGIESAAEGADIADVRMHWRAHSSHMRHHAQYESVVTDVAIELDARLAALAEAGVEPTRVVLGPGLGFAKTALLAELDALHALGHPILVGASRNSFLGHTIATDGDIPPVEERDAATTAVSAMAAAEGALCVRVHDVRSAMDAVRIARRWRAARAAHQPTTPGVPQTERARYAEAGRRWP